jgi:hypothetical protein
MPGFGKSEKGDITSMEGGKGRARSCCTRPTAASPSISMVMSARSKSRKSKSLGEEQHDEDGISNVAMTHARSQSLPSNPTFPSQPAPTPKNPPQIQLAIDRALGSSPEPPPHSRSEFPASACTNEVQNWPSPILANCTPTRHNRRGGRKFLRQVCW